VALGIDPLGVRRYLLINMSERRESLRQMALLLPLEERAELAADLLASLDGEPDADVEAAWAMEIERRAQRVLTHGSTGRSWEEIRDEASIFAD
jgi:putative addiction module component (TIGR02574 family)